MIEVTLTRIITRSDADRQYIFLTEVGGQRGFPIVIGTAEASEIHRVVHGQPLPRPLTHQLAHEIILALGAKLQAVEINDLRNNTFYARLLLESQTGDVIEVDARPSDAIALALRADSAIRVAEEVLVRANDTKD